jgi:4-hydroxythreonine-4-phosphate dehydrogenase
MTANGLRDGWNLPAPRLALCALNPHASDGGLFGDEEERIYGPALDTLHAAGLRRHGPDPGRHGVPARATR